MKTISVYEGKVNSDLTEGRGHMISVGFFANEQDAFSAIQGMSTQGCNGEVYVTEMVVYETFEEYKSSQKNHTNVGSEKKLYGWHTDCNGRFREGWTDGREFAEAEYTEYLRLKEKFDKGS